MWVLSFICTANDVHERCDDLIYGDRPFLFDMRPNESIWMVPGTVDPLED